MTVPSSSAESADRKRSDSGRISAVTSGVLEKNSANACSMAFRPRKDSPFTVWNSPSAVQCAASDFASRASKVLANESTVLRIAVRSAARLSVEAVCGGAGAGLRGCATHIVAAWLTSRTVDKTKYVLIRMASFSNRYLIHSWSRLFQTWRVTTKRKSAHCRGCFVCPLI